MTRFNHIVKIVRICHEKYFFTLAKLITVELRSNFTKDFEKKTCFNSEQNYINVFVIFFHFFSKK